MRGIIGIDPGKKGGISLVTEDNAVLYINDFSNDHELIRNRLLDIIKMFPFVEIESVFLEAPISVGTNRTINNYLFFINGFITGVAESIGLKVIRTNPMHWKKVMGVTSDKSTSIQKSLELFPTVADEVNYAHGSYKDGLAESLLIAYYGLHLNKFYPETSQIKKRTKDKFKQKEIEIWEYGLHRLGL